MISSELFRGSLKTIILKLLKEEGPMHGYAITSRVEKLTEGKIKLTYGALYPVLHKLENDGMLETTSEVINNRVRVYYRLTSSGHSLAAEKIKEMAEFIESIQIILNPKSGISYA